MNRNGGQLQAMRAPGAADDAEPARDATPEPAPLAGTLAQAGRLDRALAETLDGTGGGPALSRARLQALIAEGRVHIDGRVASTASARVAAGASFAIAVPRATPLAAMAQDIPLSIVYEDAHLIVVDKPAGLVVHPAAGNPSGTLVNALLHHCRGSLSGIGGVARPGIVHRIDKDTSGLLVVAKSDAAHEGLARQFADHSVTRAYLALCGGWPNPAEGSLRGVIARCATDRKKMALIAPHEALRRGKHAVTHYHVLQRLGGGAEAAALVACRLETGRTHQVRVHMASIGHGLLGDATYGHPARPLQALARRLGFARQALHAAELGFTHPVTGKGLRFASEIPADMRELLQHLSQ